MAVLAAGRQRRLVPPQLSGALVAVSEGDAPSPRRLAFGEWRGRSLGSSALAFPGWMYPSGGNCLSILAFGEVVHRTLGDSFRVLLLLTVVLVFLQFLVLLRRFS